ncbi:MAG: butyryl-CoA:acetate CoA-transferase [Syntrophomonadaceae bacterium]|jgi:acyl-CoA hydrolase|nr:butyryl-CoA:acetate CoA-transferase [Syntrophomonadaceae bacterium]
MSKYMDLYKEKLTTPAKAVQCVKSGDWVWYGAFTMAPPALDAALADRVGEVKDVKVKGICTLFDAQVGVRDPEHKSFIYHSGHQSAHDRHLSDKNLCYYIVGNYGLSPHNLNNGSMGWPNVAMVMTTPMDENGFFNFGPSCSYIKDVCDLAQYVILEVNENVPWCIGAMKEAIHISEVTHIVENTVPMRAFPAEIPATPEEKQIANLLVERIQDGSCLQFGIGGMPQTIGKILAYEANLKDLGIHSEMFADCFVDLVEQGVVNGKKKNVDTGKITYTFAIGSQRMYDFMDKNPVCLTYPVDITNSTERIGLLDNMVSINNAVQVDLFTQINSESNGPRQISGVGGQLDFTIGCIKSKGGQSYICMTSTRSSGGKLISRIVPTLSPGSIVSVPRHYASNIVTEYGIVNVAGKSLYARAELLISIAHPDFRDELVKAAQDLNIWTKTNKID